MIDEMQLKKEIEKELSKEIGRIVDEVIEREVKKDLKKQRNKEIGKKVLTIAGIGATVCVGVFVVPKLIKSASAYIYKHSSSDIDFDNLGPEIVKKEKKTQEMPIVSDVMKDDSENVKTQETSTMADGENTPEAKDPQ